MFRILPNENNHFYIERFLCTPHPIYPPVDLDVCIFVTRPIVREQIALFGLTMRFSSRHHGTNTIVTKISLSLRSPKKTLSLQAGVHEKRLIYPFPRVGPSVQQHYNTVIITVVTRKLGPWDAETFRPNHCVIYVIYARAVRHGHQESVGIFQEQKIKINKSFQRIFYIAYDVDAHQCRGRGKNTSTEIALVHIITSLTVFWGRGREQEKRKDPPSNYELTLIGIKNLN